MSVFGFKIVRNKRAKRDKKKSTEFSKRVVVAMTLLWFMAAIFGGVVVYLHNYGLESLLTFVGAPMTGGILGYMLKSAFENTEKIKRSTTEGKTPDDC